MCVLARACWSPVVAPSQRRRSTRFQPPASVSHSSSMPAYCYCLRQLRLRCLVATSLLDTFTNRVHCHSLTVSTAQSIACFNRLHDQITIPNARSAKKFKWTERGQHHRPPPGIKRNRGPSEGEIKRSTSLDAPLRPGHQALSAMDQMPKKQSRPQEAVRRPGRAVQAQRKVAQGAT